MPPKAQVLIKINFDVSQTKVQRHSFSYQLKYDNSSKEVQKIGPRIYLAFIRLDDSTSKPQASNTIVVSTKFDSKPVANLEAHEIRLEDH